MKLPRYPKYKDSGVKWLGKMPEHWNTLPFFVVGREVYSRNTGMRENNLLSLSYGRVIAKDIDSNEGLLPESFETYQIVNQNDIIFRLTDLQNDQRSLRTAIVRERGIVTSAYVAVTPRDILPEYLNYLLRAYDLSKVFYSMGGGLRQSLKYSDLKRIPMLVPPIEEQKKIVLHLNRETEQIDQLFVEQEHLIELLREKRQAIISHAVTKGIDPDAPMKASGITWVGETPSSWGITKLGRSSFMQEGPGLRNWQFTEAGTRVICVTNITENGIDFSCFEKFISFEEYLSNYLRFTVKVGDILMSSSGNSWGKVAIFNGDDGSVILNTSTIRINEAPQKPLLRDYLQFLLQSETVREQLKLAMTGACQPNFGPSHLKTVLIAVPKRNEQSRIATFLDCETAKIDRLIAEALRVIEQLQERRASLISAAVTGQIDVRAYCPEEAAAVCQ